MFLSRGPICRARRVCFCERLCPVFYKLEWLDDTTEPEGFYCAAIGRHERRAFTRILNPAWATKSPALRELCRSVWKPLLPSVRLRRSSAPAVGPFWPAIAGRDGRCEGFASMRFFSLGRQALLDGRAARFAVCWWQNGQWSPSPLSAIHASCRQSPP